MNEITKIRSVMVRMTEDEHAAISVAALKRKRKISTYVREIALKDAARVNK
jgi:uncharacterized protein (DUF1778 family)